MSILNHLMKRSLIFFIFLLPLFLIASAQKEKLVAVSKEAYIERYSAIAIKEMYRSGIPASITLAQGILESRYGNSTLSQRSNNHFGIKCHSDWKGPKVYYDDDAKNECFRKYRHAEHSYRDHTDFLVTKRRYAFLFKLNPRDYKGWARGLKKAGYATDPKYPQRLIAIIEEYNLNNLDKGKHYAVKSKDSKIKTTAGTNNLSDIFYFNRIKTVLAKESDSYEALAKKYDIRVKRLYEYNELDRGTKLTAGAKVYLQPKRNSGTVKYHIIGAGEDLYYISQKYGIKLAQLKKRNLITGNQTPAIGEKIYIRGKRKSHVKYKRENSAIKKYKYTIRQGDTLYSIARKLGMTVEELKKINNLNSNDINVGDELIIKL